MNTFIDTVYDTEGQRPNNASGWQISLLLRWRQRRGYRDKVRLSVGSRRCKL